jgi:hypothetical protein
MPDFGGGLLNSQQWSQGGSNRVASQKARAKSQNKVEKRRLSIGRVEEEMMDNVQPRDKKRWFTSILSTPSQISTAGSQGKGK